MQEPGAFTAAARVRSFVHGFAGLAEIVRGEHNARIHLAATLAVLAAAAWFRIPPTEWLWVITAISLVWVAEAFNTALESLCDTVHPDRHAGIRRAKDAAAAGVLCAAAGALVIGLIVFVPHVRLALR